MIKVWKSPQKGNCGQKGLAAPACEQADIPMPSVVLGPPIKRPEATTGPPVDVSQVSVEA